MVSRKADHYCHNYECMHKPTNYEIKNLGKEGEDKAKAVHKEKVRVVMASIIASAGLLILKFSVGALTNSLGILSEGMHSGLDLIAALVTLYAIRMVLRPSDSKAYHL